MLVLLISSAFGGESRLQAGASAARDNEPDTDTLTRLLCSARSRAFKLFCGRRFEY